MKIVISGYYGFDNLGDEAILKAIITSLKKVDSTIDITVLSNNPAKTQNSYNVKAINRWNLYSIYKNILKSDGLISGGGSLFQDITSSRSVIYYSIIIALAKLARKPVFIYAQGVGPLNKKISRKIVKYFFNKTNYITLRDNESKDLIENIGVNKDIHIVTDPVMGFDFDKQCKINTISNKSYIVISIRDWNQNESGFLNNIASVCDKIIENGIDVVFVPMHGELDEKVSKHVGQIMKNEPIILSHKLTIEQKVMYIRNAKLMIGMRLHALIFAANVSTPMIGISYDPKIDSYLKLVDQESIGSVTEPLDVDRLLSLALEKIKNYQKEKVKLERYTHDLKKLASSTASIAIDVFKRKSKL